MIETAWAFVIEQFKTNETFSGVFGAGMIMAGVMAVLTYARSIPSLLVRLFMTLGTITCKVYHDERVYHNLVLWMSRHKDAKKSRKIGFVSWWDNETEEYKHDITPGEGLHIFWQGFRPFFIHREVTKPGDKQNAMVLQRQEMLTVWTFGRDQDVFRRLNDAISKIHQDTSKIAINYWNNGFHSTVRRAKRSLTSVFMDERLKLDLVTRLDLFLSRRQWYADRGIPWRLGISLEGPAGTGKTSLIIAIASYLSKPIYIVNPSVIENDAQLHEALNSAGNAIVVIEDADSIQELLDREIAGNKKKAVVNEDGKATGITLSGFLNAIDGIASHEGRILFITSNCADSLDGAVMRKGRVDERIFMGHVFEDIATRMFSHFYPDEDAAPFVATLTFPLAPAAIQDALLTYVPRPALKLVANDA